MSKPKYDKQALGTEYITGDLSLRDLSAIHGIRLATLAGYSKAGEWERKRNEYRTALTTARTGLMLDRKLFDKAAFDAMCEQAVDLAVTQLTIQISSNFERQLLPKGDARHEDALPVMVLDEMIGAIRHAQEIKYRALGIAPPKQRIEHSGNLSVVTDAAAEAARIRAKREEWDKSQKIPARA